MLPIFDGALVRLVPQAYEKEVDSNCCSSYPDLLAGEQMDADEPRRWLFIAAEPPISDQVDGADRWSLDLLFVDQDAIPTLVEVKRKSDSRLRREVVGQMLDYAANAVAYWPAEKLRRLFSESCRERGHDADDVLGELLGNKADTRP